ncbi:MAG TPA: aminodeoxychorismate/anthranilate synthase component II [Chloroflexota bacterium]|nr:aminodeoxychorismate/anthranilate synthase component II [Chloroflexota bacterium]
MIVVVDNYDSFTYNLVQYLGELGETLAVYRNDQTTVEEIAALSPEAIVVSPGPCAPADAGISVDVLRRLGPTVPTLGVCLGHQCIGEAFGARVIRAPEIMHGKTSLVYHDGEGLFAGLPNPLEAIRYHSLIVERSSLPETLISTAQTSKGLIMGLRHASYPVVGVQFHPESIMTTSGKDLLRNFMRMARGETPGGDK